MVMSVLTILVCCIVLFLNKSRINKTTTYGLVGIVFLECVRIFISFQKINMLFPLIIMIFCSYFYYNKEISAVKISERSSLYKYEDFFPIVALIILSLLMLLEWKLFDGDLNSNGYLLIILSLLLIFARNVPKTYDKEYLFLLVFFFLLVIFIVFPSVTYKIINDTYESSHGTGWISNEYIVSMFLTIPLSNFLGILGYNVYAQGKLLYYEDLEVGRLASVEIAESCSGLYSITIFLAAFISYSLVNYKIFDFRTLVFILFGLLICYISNIFRMAIIVISGHYYGHDTLLWVHSNIGWLIFVFWLSLFWILVEKVLFSKTATDL